MSSIKPAKLAAALKPGSDSLNLVASSSQLVAGSSQLVAHRDRPPDVVAFEQQMVGFFGEIAEALNVPRSLAAIYGILFASPVPLTFADIAARLDFSKGSISQGLRTLREMGAIKAVSSRQLPAARASRLEAYSSEDAEGTLRSGSDSLEAECSKLRAPVAYAPDTEMRQIIAHFLASRVDDQLKSAKTRFKGFHAGLSAFPSGEQKILKQRVKKLEAWHGKASALVPLMRTFLKLGA